MLSDALLLDPYFPFDYYIVIERKLRLFRPLHGRSQIYKGFWRDEGRCEPPSVAAARQQRQEREQEQNEVILLVVRWQKHHGVDERRPFEVVDSLAAAHLHQVP